jgi:hypothetical protein
MKGIRLVFRNAAVFIALILVAGCVRTEVGRSPVAANFRLNGNSVLASSTQVNYGAPGKPIVISNDYGGELVRYVFATKKLRRSGEAIRLRGQCDSACTLLLSLPKKRLCVYPGASFGFHRAYGASTDMNRSATAYMRRAYPGWVNKWIDAEGGLTSDIKRMDFEYLRRHIPLCPQASVRAVGGGWTQQIARRTDPI